MVNHETEKTSAAVKADCSRLPVVLDHMPQHIALLDSSGTLLAVNLAWRNFAVANNFAGSKFGVGENYIAVCETASGESAEGAETIAIHIREVISGKRSDARIEYPCHTLEKKRWFQCRIIRFDENDDLQLVVVHEDITEIRLAQEARDESLSRYLAMFEHSPICMHEIDLDGQLVLMNRAGLNMINVTSMAEIQGLSYVDFVCEKDRSRIVQLLESAIKGQESSFEFTTPGDSILSSCFIPIKDRNGVVTHLMGITQNITESLKKQQQLEESEFRFRHAAEKATDLIFLVDGSSEKIAWYGDILGNLGFTPKNLAELTSNVHPLQHQQVKFETEKFLRGGLDYNTEFRICRADGKYCYWQLTISWLDGNKTRAIGSIKDVTLQRQEEEFNQKRDKELLLHLESLTHFNRVETLGSMAIGIAHEINQPLAAIDSYTEACKRYLRKDRSNLERPEELLEKISKQSKRAGRILSKLRSMLTRGSLDQVELDLNSVLVDISNIAESQVRLHDCTFEMELASELAPIHGDEIQIQQVVLNLIHNAIDAMVSDADCTDRTIRLESLQKSNREVEVRVSDNGPGIDPLVGESIFDAFHSSKDNGLGMGLVICKNIVKSHGGKIWHSNREGKGACLHFSLPIEIK